MNIALITEGVSEHRIIKHFVTKYLRGIDVDVNQIQPLVANNKQQGTGGWNEVLKYCTREDIRQILKENDFLIIQIDSDQSGTKPFDVNHSIDGRPKAIEEIWNDIERKLKSLIQSDILQQFTDKIIFAICIHTIECWLLPFYCSGVNKSATNQCIRPLNTALRTRNMLTISNNKNSPNSAKAYNELLRSIKKADLIAASEYSFGLKQLITSLDVINASNDPIE